MAKRRYGSKLEGGIILALVFVMLAFSGIGGARSQPGPGGQGASSLQAELKPKNIAFRIVYETYRQTEGKQNWELYIMNADGSSQSNLTNTPDLDEMFGRVSPDGGKICFVTDELVKGKKRRSIYYMNIDGRGRVKVAANARQPCWSPDGKVIAYTKGEFDRYTTTDYATKGLFFYDLKTAEHEEHPNGKLLHLYNLCWSPDGKWLIATVHGAMGYKHTNLAIRADGTNVFDLGFGGCRPDVSPDGSKIVWCPDEKVLWVGDLDLASPRPRVTNKREVFVKSGGDIYQQQADWSPDGKFIAFGRGPKEGGGGRYPVAPGNPAKGWDICVGDATGKWIQITNDGNHNKEPDWVPIQTSQR